MINSVRLHGLQPTRLLHPWDFQGESTGVGCHCFHLLAWDMSTIVRWLAHSLAWSFLGTEMRTDLFQSCGHCWVFQICWHIECSSFIASSFSILNSSAGIPSPPLALFIVMLPNTHWTSHSKMSVSRWVTTPSWLSGSLRPFLYSSCILANSS